MAIKQTRRSISVRGATYEALRADCGERNISISDHIEQLIAADFDDRGISIGGDKAPAAALHCSGKRCACASCSSVLKRAKLSAPRVQGCRARLIEALQQAAADLGFTPEQGRQLAIETVQGAAALAAQSSEPATLLRERVTSKGGTTEAALQMMAEKGVKEGIIVGVKAAEACGRELGKLLGSE